MKSIVLTIWNMTCIQYFFYRMSRSMQRVWFHKFCANVQKLIVCFYLGDVILDSTVKNWMTVQKEFFTILMHYFLESTSSFDHWLCQDIYRSSCSSASRQIVQCYCYHRKQKYFCFTVFLFMIALHEVVLHAITINEIKYNIFDHIHSF